MFHNYDFKSMRTMECDTLVIGGGVAGSSAAIASARSGAKTILVEAGGTLGGQAGIGLVTPLSSEKSKSGVSFGGLLDEIIERTSKLTKKYMCVNEPNGSIYTISPHILKYVLLKMAYESMVHICLHTVLCDVETEENRITFAILHDKSGYVKVKAKNFIDASGDADLVYLSGDNYVLGSEKGVFEQLISNNINFEHKGDTCDEYSGENLMQPVSLFFIMRGVDYEKASQFNNKHIQFEDLGITKEEFEKWEFAGTEGFEITSNYVPTPQNRILVSHGRHKDEAVVNMSRIININGANAEDLSEGEVRAQLQLIAIVDFLQTFVPGFENSYLVESSSRLGVRETRRLCGKYILTGEDVIKCYKFDDAVCKAQYIIDIHDPRGKCGAIGGSINGDYYEIPFRSLCSMKFNNLLVCGRCISCDHVAHSATRIQGSCILTGQAAGTATAISCSKGIPACDVPTDLLRKVLMKNNVNLE